MLEVNEEAQANGLIREVTCHDLFLFPTDLDLTSSRVYLHLVP